MQFPIHIFLDTSVMPHHLLKPGAEFDVLTELAKASLVKLHASTIALQEWRSQMVFAQKTGLGDLFKGLHTLLRQGLTKDVRNFKDLQTLESAKEDIEDDIEKLAKEKIDEFLAHIGLNEVDLQEKDAKKVFRRYFAGKPPFSSPKVRNDLPDAFIFEAANNLFDKLHGMPVLAVCADDRLQQALGSIKEWKAFKTMKALLESAELVEPLTHLAIYKAWKKREKSILAYVKTDASKITEKLEEFGYNGLLYREFSDYGLPTDTDATIDHVDEVRDVHIDSDDPDVVAPGWMFIRFSFECDADLSMQVYRMNAFGVPAWITVDIGDFERDHTFDARGHATLEVVGNLSLRFTLEDLEKDKPEPSEIEVNEVQIELGSGYREDY